MYDVCRGDRSARANKMVIVIVQRIASILGAQVPVFVRHDTLATALQVMKILCLYSALQND